MKKFMTFVILFDYKWMIYVAFKVSGSIPSVVSVHIKSEQFNNHYKLLNQ